MYLAVLSSANRKLKSKFEVMFLFFDLTFCLHYKKQTLATLVNCQKAALTGKEENTTTH